MLMIMDKLYIILAIVYLYARWLCSRAYSAGQAWRATIGNLVYNLYTRAKITFLSSAFGLKAQMTVGYMGILCIGCYINCIPCRRAHLAYPLGQMRARAKLSCIQQQQLAASAYSLQDILKIINLFFSFLTWIEYFITYPTQYHVFNSVYRKTFLFFLSWSSKCFGIWIDLGNIS